MSTMEIEVAVPPEGYLAVTVSAVKEDATVRRVDFAMPAGLLSELSAAELSTRYFQPAVAALRPLPVVMVPPVEEPTMQGTPCLTCGETIGTEDAWIRRDAAGEHELCAKVRVTTDRIVTLRREIRQEQTYLAQLMERRR